jgi:hypothetical protein
MGVEATLRRIAAATQVTPPQCYNADVSRAAVIGG